MTALTFNPFFVSDVPTSALTNIANSTPGAGEEWSLNIRATNKTSADILYRLYLTTSADSTFTAGIYRAFDFKIKANDAVDVEQKLTIPAGYKLAHRASATGLDVSGSGRKRAA